MKRTLTALTTLALAAGCTSSATHVSVRHPTPQHRTVVITEKDAGHVVAVHRGDVVSWQLHSTYWTLIRPPGGELVRTAEHVVPVEPKDQHSCHPGQGCGVVQLDLRAARAGRVTLQAHRVSCGEAMRCVGSQGSFVVTVDVL